MNNKGTRTTSVKSCLGAFFRTLNKFLFLIFPSSFLLTLNVKVFLNNILLDCPNALVIDFKSFCETFYLCISFSNVLFVTFKHFCIINCIILYYFLREMKQKTKLFKNMIRHVVSVCRMRKTKKGICHAHETAVSI